MKRLLVLALVAVALSGCARGYGITTSRMALNNEPLIPEPVIHRNLKPAVRLIALHGPRDAEYMRFSREVPLEYDMSVEGAFLPLMEMDITAPRSRVWYKSVFEGEQIDSLFNTVVTFVVWEGDLETGFELARFVGYNDKDSFYQQVNLVIDMYYLKDPKKRARHW